MRSVAPLVAPQGQVFVTTLGAFVVSLDLSIVNVAFPAMAGRPSPTRAARVGVGHLGVLDRLRLAVGGRWAHGGPQGLRRVFFAGLLTFTLGSALCGVAPSVALLIAGRALQGVGAAFTLPASVGLLLASVPQERRSQTVALWGGVGALAVATVPARLADRLDLRVALGVLRELARGRARLVVGRHGRAESARPARVPSAPISRRADPVAERGFDHVLAIRQVEGVGVRDSRVQGLAALAARRWAPLFVLRFEPTPRSCARSAPVPLRVRLPCPTSPR